MTNLVGYPVEIQQLRASATWTRFAGGTLRVYSATRPTTNGAAITSQTLLAEYVIPDPAGVITEGIFTGASMGPAIVLENGTAAWARAIDGTGTVLADLDAGVTGSGAACEFDNILLVAGAYLTLASLVIAEG